MEKKESGKVGKPEFWGVGCRVAQGGGGAIAENLRRCGMCHNPDGFYYDDMAGLREAFPILVTGFMGVAAQGLMYASVARFAINANKFDYFFGRVVSGSPHNIARSAQNLKDLTYLGITNESQLMSVFNEAIGSGNVLSSSTTQYGTTIMRSINVGNNGSIGVGFFYPGGNMSSIPSITTIIPKTW